MSSVTSSLIDNILTDDCLLEIFKSTSSPRHDFSSSLITVSGVSKRWRNLALANSALWSTFLIDENDINLLSLSGRQRYNPSAVFPRIAIMLQRSRQLPLSMAIKAGENSAFDTFTIDRLVNLLSPHVDHISSFGILSSSWKHQLSLSVMFAGRYLPLLEGFCIHHRYSPSQDYDLDFPVTTRTQRPLLVPFMNSQESSPSLCPNLKVLALIGAFCDWTTPYTGGSLTEIILTSIPFASRPTTKELCVLLEKNKNTLTTLNIGAMPYNDSAGFVPIVELPYLTDLRMEYAWPYELTVFANHVRVPALTSLEIVNASGGPGVLSPARVQDIYSRTADGFASIVRYFPLHQVEKLKMSDVQFGPHPTNLDFQSVEHLPVVYQFFHRLRNVTHVEFQNAGEYWLQAASCQMVEQASNVSVMPKLETFSSTVTNDLDGTDMLGFIRRRRLNGAPKWHHMDLVFMMSMKETVCANPDILLASKTSQVVFRHWPDDVLEEEYFIHASDEPNLKKKEGLLAIN